MNVGRYCLWRVLQLCHVTAPGKNSGPWVHRTPHTVWFLLWERREAEFCRSTGLCARLSSARGVQEEFDPGSSLECRETGCEGEDGTCVLGRGSSSARARGTREPRGLGGWPLGSAAPDRWQLPSSFMLLDGIHLLASFSSA